MFENIFVAYDGSDIAQKALETSCDMARRYESKLTVMHVNVIATNLKTQAMNSPSLAAVLDAAGERVAQKAEEYLAGKGVDYKITVINAPSAPKPLIDYIESNPVDLVIMGSRGLGAVKQYFGSVSHAVLNTVKVPVLIIKG